jgi:polyribonucleotide nucleotidyltransferase
MELGGHTLKLETGHWAKQADGAVVVHYGDTVLLVTAVGEKKAKPEMDFFPLTVEYREKTYAAGKIPGGFFKREGRPRDREIVSARQIDRTIRPLFPDGYRSEVQVICTVLSTNQEHDPDVLGVVGASAALTISDIPFSGPVAAVRVGRINNNFIINPTYSEIEEGDISLVVAGSEESIVMVEGESKEVSENDMLEALKFGHDAIKKIINAQKELLGDLGGVEKRIPEIPEVDEELVKLVHEKSHEKVKKAVRIAEKQERQDEFDAIVEEYKENFDEEEFEEKKKSISNIIKDMEKKEMRHMILTENVRSDGRGLDDIRPITCEVGVLPRTHGSAVFTRGQTQALATVTLGTKGDEQIIDDLEGDYMKTFMLHYNFPPYSVGEVRFLRGPGRREIGHGLLAEKALARVAPSEQKFPYTIRLVSEVLESNGSSSMATVCGGTLALMDAGVPIKAPVAGIAMGLIKEDDRVAILTDILGLEDHLGDMDFKVAGTREGITAFQMDIKVSGLSYEIMAEALEKARQARFFILDKIVETIESPRESLSQYAPRIITLHINPDKIRDVIGPGGKVIRKIIEETGASIDLEDDGTVFIASTDAEGGKKAKEIIEELTEEAELGKIYKGKVAKVVDFGAFVEILPNQDGLLHISEIDFYRVNKVTDILREGDTVMVKVIGIDNRGKIKLSRKAALKELGKEMNEDLSGNKQKGGKRKSKKNRRK